MPDQTMMEVQHDDADSISLPTLLPELQLRVLGFLPRNEVATTARQLCKEAHLHFADKTVTTSALEGRRPSLPLAAVGVFA